MYEKIGQDFVFNPSVVSAASNIKDKGITVYGENMKLLGFVVIQEGLDPALELNTAFDAVVRAQGKSIFISLPDGSFFKKDTIGSVSIVKSAVVINGLDGHVLYWLELESPEEAKNTHNSLVDSLCSSNT